MTETPTLFIQVLPNLRVWRRKCFDYEEITWFVGIDNAVRIMLCAEIDIHLQNHESEIFP